jgi:hypothetical protein
MNHFLQTKPKNNCPEIHFHACKKWAGLLKIIIEAAMAPFRGGKVFAFISLFERWFLSTDSQAGEFLLPPNVADAAQAIVAFGPWNHKIQTLISLAK